MISGHKNLNILQQVEMLLCHVYFRHCHTTWSTAHAYYIILSKKFPRLKISLALHRPQELLLNIKGPLDRNYIER